MKTALSFGLLLAAASTLFACSEDEGEACRTNCGGSGNATGNLGGTSNNGNGGSSNAGTSNAGNAGSGGGDPGYTYGAALAVGELDGAEVPVSEPTAGINGAGFIAQSMVMEVVAQHTSAGGKLCMSGETAAVVNDDYGSAWGAELIVDLARPTDDAPAGDAGAGDAGAADGGGGVIQPTTAWPMGEVIGFAYTMEGQGPDGAGVPDLGLRFKALPEGGVGDNDSYCATRCLGVDCPAHGATDHVLFSQINYECYNAAPGTTLADDTISLRGEQVGGEAPLVPNPRKLLNISWQVNADPGVTKPFNFCVSNVRPILTAPAP